jgi:hypothetical protein
VDSTAGSRSYRPQVLTIIGRKSGDHVNKLLMFSPMAQAGANGEAHECRSGQVPISCTRPF